MPTLLVNSRMDPMLAERVQACVAGRRNVVRVRTPRRLLGVLRLAIGVCLLLIISAAFWSKRSRRLELERSRTALFGEWQHQVSGAYDGRREFLSRVHRLLSDASGEYDGDFVDPELKASKSLSEELSKRSVYVRGPLASFLTSIGISKTAAESGRDAFLLCLLEPPSSVAEKDCLPKARLALSAGPAAHQSSMNFHRLDELEAAAPYLSESWGNRIGKATDTATLSRLERELKKAPLSAAKQAAGAERLLVVVDEPNDLGGVTELDGEHAHSARVVMWDLTTGKAILRFRTKVDPEWITPNRRSQYARELDGCKLALTLRDFVVGVKVK